MTLSGGNEGLAQRARAQAGEQGRSTRSLDRLRKRTRLGHYSQRTERACIGWIRRFIPASDRRHPRETGGPEKDSFLTALATRGRVRSPLDP